jgi:hypothetical protein
VKEWSSEGLPLTLYPNVGEKGNICEMKKEMCQCYEELGRYSETKVACAHVLVQAMIRNSRARFTSACGVSVDTVSLSFLSAVLELYWMKMDWTALLFLS